MQAAAKNLTSVTLELGGKSPAVVDETADITHAAQRIVWGKFSNCGQTCIAPDYVLVHHTQEKNLIAAMKTAINDFYGTTDHDQIHSKSYGRIVNQRHFDRLLTWLQDAVNNGATVVAGGTYTAEQNFLSPTLVQHIAPNDALMQEEIFGPILPIIPYKNTDDALRIINGKHKPLALYIFSKNSKKIEEIIDNTTAGGTCVNNTLIHFFNHNLPFGGVNNSGIGKTHGFFGFQAFSNQRSIVRQNLSVSATQMMYPPYDTHPQRKQNIIDLSLKYL
jgi:aldehyde dehydrogenase (NAD+)